VDFRLPEQDKIEHPADRLRIPIAQEEEEDDLKNLDILDPRFQLHSFRQRKWVKLNTPTYKQFIHDLLKGDHSQKVICLTCWELIMPDRRGQHERYGHQLMIAKKITSEPAFLKLVKTFDRKSDDTI
jgi:hypothetical protein